MTLKCLFNTQMTVELVQFFLPVDRSISLCTPFSLIGVMPSLSAFSEFLELCFPYKPYCSYNYHTPSSTLANIFLYPQLSFNLASTALYFYTNVVLPCLHIDNLSMTAAFSTKNEHIVSSLSCSANSELVQFHTVFQLQL